MDNNYLKDLMNKYLKYIDKVDISSIDLQKLLLSTQLNIIYLKQKTDFLEEKIKEIEKK